MAHYREALFVVPLYTLCVWGVPSAAADITIGSKGFTESVILGELAAQMARGAGVQVIHRRQLGGSTVLWNALQSGSVDLYPEYTGTIRQELLAGRDLRSEAVLGQALGEWGVAMSRPLGFNNTYAIGMRKDVAERNRVRTISDLREHPNLRFGFTNEVMNRSDGWPGLRSRYGLPQRHVRGMEHALAYAALESGAIDATDLYSTDPEIASYNLAMLRDDLRFFPAYHAVLLYRTDLAERCPQALKAVLELEGRISEAAMIEMNQRAQPRFGPRVPEDRVAFEFLRDHPYFAPAAESAASMAPPPHEGMVERLTVLTGQHLFLVAVSLAAAIAVAVPLGVLAARRPSAGQAILGCTGIIQTVPSLALLVFLIPVFGLGARPAVVALFLYSLLPIVRNTYAGLHDLTVQTRESARALGLPPWARLRLVELPLASRSILAGIKTSAVINVGTATLGGLIGAGGYGERIVTGLRLNNVGIILEGAIPAAVMAIVVQGVFELAERRMVPRGLRLKPEA
jgi:osmoprotectant transport system permease protein